MNITVLLCAIIIILTLLLTVALYFSVKMAKNHFYLLSMQIKETAEHNVGLLNNQIKNSIEPKFIDVSPSTQNLVEIAIETWRLEKRIGKVSADLSDDQNKAFENSVAKFKRFLDKSDITFTDYTDQKYNEGLNLDVLSIEKDSSISESIIKETHEPAVFHRGQLIKKAKVVVLEK